jgi:hypothetical protein
MAAMIAAIILRVSQSIAAHPRVVNDAAARFIPNPCQQ